MRSLRSGDIDALKRIHKEFYPDDVFPNIASLSSLVVITEDGDDGDIIVAGGIDLVCEGVSISNLRQSPLQRGKALKHLLRHMAFTCHKLDRDILHAFVSGDNPTWIKALQQHGFEQSQQTMLFKRV